MVEQYHYVGGSKIAHSLVTYKLPPRVRWLVASWLIRRRCARRDGSFEDVSSVQLILASTYMR